MPNNLGNPIESSVLIDYFYFLTTANICLVVYNLFDSITTIAKWNPILFDINQKGNLIEDDEIEQFEEKISSAKLLSNIFKKVKTIKANVALSDNIKVDEIIFDEMNLWERRLNFFSNNFILLGILFTVVGLFTALPSSIEKLTDYNAINTLLTSFGTAFRTTIIGLVLAFAVKAVQTLTGNKRKVFKHNILLAVNNIYSAPDINEKSLGRLVKLIEKSSKKIETAAGAIEKLAIETNIGTENIEKAVSSFAIITDKISQNEESFNKTINELSQRLSDLKSNQEDTIKPLIDRMLNDFSDSKVQNASNLNSLKEIQDQQSKLNDSMNKSMKDIAKSNEKLGSFFGEVFEDIFKKSMEELNKEYSSKLTSIQGGINNIVIEIDKGLNAQKMDERLTDIQEKIEKTMSDVYEEVNKITVALGNLWSSVNEAGLNNNSIEQRCDEIKNDILKLDGEIKSIHTISYEIQDNIASNDFNSIKSSLEVNKESFKKLYDQFDYVKTELDNILETVSNIQKKETGSVFGGIGKLFSSND